MGGWKFDRDRPIFRQIAEHLRSDIAGGRYSAGERLPSVREFALEIGVNPNTVQRALAMLESEGILETRRGDGRYVCGGDNVRHHLTESMSSELCRQFIVQMRALGFDNGMIVEEVRQAIISENK